MKGDRTRPRGSGCQDERAGSGASVWRGTRSAGARGRAGFWWDRLPKGETKNSLPGHVPRGEPLRCQPLNGLRRISLTQPGFPRTHLVCSKRCGSNRRGSNRHRSKHSRSKCHRSSCTYRPARACAISMHAHVTRPSPPHVTHRARPFLLPSHVVSTCPALGKMAAPSCSAPCLWAQVSGQRTASLLAIISKPFCSAAPASRPLNAQRLAERLRAQKQEQTTKKVPVSPKGSALDGFPGGE